MREPGSQHKPKFDVQGLVWHILVVTKPVKLMGLKDVTKGNVWVSAELREAEAALFVVP